MNFDNDRLTGELAALTADAPDALLDRVAARWVRVPGPLGDLYVASTDHGVAYLRLAEVTPDEEAFAASFHDRFERPLLPASQPPAGLFSALRGDAATDLRFDLRDSTGFAREVLSAVRTIPRGEVRPYAWVAKEIGNPKAVRAVGTALNHNPVPLLIPCHRVVLSSGEPGQYAFGPTMKRRLLESEGADLRGIR